MKQSHEIAIITLRTLKELATKEANSTDFPGSYGEGYRAAMRLILASIQGAENAVSASREGREILDGE